MPGWSYTYRQGPVVASHATSGWFALAVIAVTVLGELGVIAAILWGGVLGDRLLDGAAARHRSSVRRRARPLGSDDLAALDDHLDRMWDEEVEASRRRAATEASRLVRRCVPVVGVRPGPRGRLRGPGNQACTQVTFADGTTLVLWSSERTCTAKLRHLPPEAVLQHVPAEPTGALRFGTASTAVFVRGELLVPGDR
jgi:hypothetical protein